MDRLKNGTYVGYGFVVETADGDEEYWYYGEIKEFKEVGIGEDGDEYKVAVVDFPKDKEVEDNVTFWKSKEGYKGALGWSILDGEGELKKREKIASKKRVQGTIAGPSEMKKKKQSLRKI